MRKKNRSANRKAAGRAAGDALGPYTRDQLEQMDGAFIDAVKRAFQSGGESKEAASATARLRET